MNKKNGRTLHEQKLADLFFINNKMADLSINKKNGRPLHEQKNNRPLQSSWTKKYGRPS